MVKDKGEIEKLSYSHKERAVDDMLRYLATPDDPMVSSRVANNPLRSTDFMNIPPSKLYEDDGWSIEVVRGVLRRARETSPPRTAEEFWNAGESYFAMCHAFQIPPLWSFFAVWCGMDINTMLGIMRDPAKQEVAEVLNLIRETIRSFLEMKALDNTINPILYFHQNKVYFGAVENNANVNVTIDHNVELSAVEVARRVEDIKRLSIDLTGEECDYIIVDE